ncbi:helix-turn-helix transcriptional regulator [Robiginitalea aurantiaca]|uniref:AraC family transcriptional regulator n=1 Tax=Robiginitalea aurantiaca TaxID=3056915 RepID=A0ABT7WAM6_9FLAO|nr:AraC family transcriptional regulator [Robiginitalea aurantiaca]MDM9629975.1 AraC family transcriptional regulator [Robiginitalea aurantiaca]
MSEDQKNVASGSFDELQISPDFVLLKAINEEAFPARLQREVDQRFIQFHFNLKGHAQFVYHKGHYVLELPENQSLLLYNPETELPLHTVLSPGSSMISILMSIRKFHALFTSEADYIPFLSSENRDKKYYKQNPVSPSQAIILSQLWNEQIHPSVKGLYCKGKIYELLSLYFNRNTETSAEQCPFLMDEENVQRIRQAKEIVIERMAEPPGLKELAAEIGLSLKKLKEGFKQIYGDSVYSFLFDYKMEVARKMLESGKFNVNEVGLKVGYSTASHFIAAFKKKYHTTPKQYLLSMAQERT